MGGGEPIRMQLLNALGQVLKEKVYSTITEASQMQIDVSDLIPGIYFIRIDDGHTSALKKLIKE
jgi:hypothetical protein